MGIKAALYSHMITILIQYASPQLNYNYQSYYPNAMQNYGYGEGYQIPQVANKPSDEESPLEIEIRSKTNPDTKYFEPRAKDCCESENLSPECTSREREGSLECRKCTCKQCLSNKHHSRPCCPSSCEKCAMTPPPGLAVMAYPFPYPMAVPIHIPIPFLYNVTTENSTKLTTDTTGTTDQTNEDKTTTNIVTEKPTEKTDPTTEKTNPTTEKTDPTTEKTNPTTEKTKPTTEKTVSTDTTKETTTPTTTQTTEPNEKRRHTQNFDETTESSGSGEFFQLRAPHIGSTDKKGRPKLFEQHAYPHLIRRDSYFSSGSKDGRHLYLPNRSLDEDEGREIRMMLVGDRNKKYGIVTYPPNRLPMIPNGGVNEMARKDYRGMENVMHHEPNYRRASSYKMPKYGILPLSDKMATKLLLRLRTMKELNGKAKNIPKLRKLKQR